MSLIKKDRSIHKQPGEARLQLNANGVAKSEQFPAYDNIDRTSEANLCFFIQLSGASLAMAPRLVARLWHPRNVILLHIDAKVPDDAVVQFTSMLKTNSSRFSNVHILEREPITYAGVSMVLNTLGAMEYALSLAQPWDYFINISGSDYPLISVRNMRILYGQPRALRQKVTFIQLFYSNWNYKKRERYERLYADPVLGLSPNSNASNKLRKVMKLDRNVLPMKASFVHSEGWITAHRNFVRASARGAYARRLLALLARSTCVDEHFFSMLAWNTRLNRTTAHYAGRSVFWKYKGKHSGQHPYNVDRQHDLYAFWEVMKRGPGIFARKFSRRDSSLMYRIDTELAGIAPQSNVTSVDEKFRTVLLQTMCSADIEGQWYRAPRADYSKCTPQVH